MIPAETSLPLPTPHLSDSVMQMFSLAGKTAIITGGSGGIGHEIAKGLAEAGANVALWYNSSQKTEQYCLDIEAKYHVKAKAYKCDLTTYSSVSKCIESVIEDFGDLTHMIANAGIPSTTGCLDSNTSDWDKVVATDLSGAFFCAKAAAHYFKSQHDRHPQDGVVGNIIFTASMSGHIVNVPQMQGCYNACKAGVIHLAKSLAVEFAPWCRVNSVSPGYIDTEISTFVDEKVKKMWLERIPMGREADPRELKGVFLYLASEASSYTTGADILVDGGYSIV